MPTPRWNYEVTRSLQIRASNPDPFILRSEPPVEPPTTGAVQTGSVAARMTTVRADGAGRVLARSGRAG